MKIRTFILSVVLMLACVSVGMAQDVITMSIYPHGLQVPESDLSIVFGTDFETSYDIKVYNETLDYELPANNLNI